MAQLDARPENSGQILDKIAEINAPIGCKVEDDPPAVKGILYIDKTHFQFAGSNLLFTDGERFLFLTMVFLHLAGIPLIRLADHAL